MNRISRKIGEIFKFCINVNRWIVVNRKSVENLPGNLLGVRSTICVDQSTGVVAAKRKGNIGQPLKLSIGSRMHMASTPVPQRLTARLNATKIKRRPTRTGS